MFADAEQKIPSEGLRHYCISIFFLWAAPKSFCRNVANFPLIPKRISTLELYCSESLVFRENVMLYSCRRF